jgi:hypothetical protein
MSARGRIRAALEMLELKHYARRGRLFAGLSDDDLAMEWVTAFLALLELPSDQDAFHHEGGLRTEFGIRGFARPPWNLLAVALPGNSGKALETAFWKSRIAGLLPDVGMMDEFLARNFAS